jgi:hypothetical protein
VKNRLPPASRNINQQERRTAFPPAGLSSYSGHSLHSSQDEPQVVCRVIVVHQKHERFLAFRRYAIELGRKDTAAGLDAVCLGLCPGLVPRERAGGIARLSDFASQLPAPPLAKASNDMRPQIARRAYELYERRGPHDQLEAMTKIDHHLLVRRY